MTTKLDASSKLEFTATLASNKIIVSKGPTEAATRAMNAVFGSLRDLKSAPCQNMFDRLKTAPTFTATLTPAENSKFILTITTKTDRTYETPIKIDRAAADGIRSIVPPPTPFPKTALSMAGVVAGAATAYYLNPIAGTTLLTLSTVALLSDCFTSKKSAPLSTAKPPVAPATPTSASPGSSPVPAPVAAPVPPSTSNPAAAPATTAPGFVGIINGGPKGGDGSTCFMNAAFQIIMNDPELLRAIEETYTDELKKIQAQLTATDIEPETFQKLFDKSLAYSAFLSAANAYKAGRMDQIDLNPLRKLFTDANTPYVQGDSSEVILALLNPVDPQKYPQLYVKQTIERRFELYKPTWWESSFTLPGLEQHLKGSANWQQATSIMNPDRVIQESHPSYVLQIALDSKETNGTALIQQQFQETPRPDENHIDSVLGNFADNAAKQSGTLSWYYPATYKMTLPQPPARLMVELKRFKRNANGTRSKITTPVTMPEQVTIAGANYRLKSIGVHSGSLTGGHYYAYVRKNNGPWMEANDSVVSPAQDKIKNGLDNGYLYWYERV